MPLYTTIHLHNVHPENESRFAQWFDGPHRQALPRLRRLKSADRYTVAAHQIMPNIPQPWRFLSVYDFDLPAPEIDIPAVSLMQGICQSIRTEVEYNDPQPG